MKGKLKKPLILSACLFACLVVSMAFVPNRTCGCPQYEDGSQLTNFVNSVSVKYIGRKVVDMNPRPPL